MQWLTRALSRAQGNKTAKSSTKRPRRRQVTIASTPLPRAKKLKKSPVPINPGIPAQKKQLQLKIHALREFAAYAIQGERVGQQVLEGARPS